MINEKEMKKLKGARKVHIIRRNQALKYSRNETNPYKKKQFIEDARYHQQEYMIYDDLIKENE